MAVMTLLNKMSKSKSKFVKNLYSRLIRFIYACDISPKCEWGGQYIES